MDIKIKPRKLFGNVTPPPSKSMAHRLLIAAALASGVSIIRNAELSQDIEATLRCITALGGEWEVAGENDIRIRGIGGRGIRYSEPPLFDCGESGSTLRFFVPIALALAGGGIFKGQGRLMQRPMKPYFDMFDEKGIYYEKKDDALIMRGELSPGVYSLPGNVSSQFFTGLLFALPLLDGDSTLISSTELESEDYVSMTLEAMGCAGVKVSECSRAERIATRCRTRNDEGRRLDIPHGEYKPVNQTVEADWSQAGFWYAARFLGADLKIERLNLCSSQGDKMVSALSERLMKSGDVNIDISGCPDLLPPLSVMAAVRSGTTRFTNAARLRLKESDRIKTVAEMINTLGGQAEEGTDSLTVVGQSELRGGRVNGANDHRIVMAAAIAACACSSEVIITGAEAVNKSYPDFFNEYTRLGGEINVI